MQRWEPCRIDPTYFAPCHGFLRHLYMQNHRASGSSVVYLVGYFAAHSSICGGTLCLARISAKEDHERKGLISSPSKRWNVRRCWNRRSRWDDPRGSHLLPLHLSDDCNLLHATCKSSFGAFFDSTLFESATETSVGQTPPDSLLPWISKVLQWYVSSALCRSLRNLRRDNCLFTTESDKRKMPTLNWDEQ